MATTGPCSPASAQKLLRIFKRDMPQAKLLILENRLDSVQLNVQALANSFHGSSVPEPTGPEGPPHLSPSIVVSYRGVFAHSLTCVTVDWWMKDEAYGCGPTLRLLSCVGIATRQWKAQTLKTCCPNIWSCHHAGHRLFVCTCRVYVCWEAFPPDRWTFSSVLIVFWANSFQLNYEVLPSIPCAYQYMFCPHEGTCVSVLLSLLLRYRGFWVNSLLFWGLA